MLNTLSGYIRNQTTLAIHQPSALNPLPNQMVPNYYMRKRGAGYQWLAAKTGASLHEADWQPTRDFVDPDGTINEAFRRYICAHKRLPHLHHIVVADNF